MHDPFPEAMPGLDWFEAGEAVFLSVSADARLYPPLDDAIAQRAWLGGFGSAWAAAPSDSPSGAQALDDALARALHDHGALAKQLWARIRRGRSGLLH